MRRSNGRPWAVVLVLLPVVVSFSGNGHRERRRPLILQAGKADDWPESKLSRNRSSVPGVPAALDSRRQFLAASVMIPVLQSAPLFGSPQAAAARGLVPLPVKAPLGNRYFLLRAGESMADAAGRVKTNPVDKLAVENGLTQNGRIQAEAAAAELVKKYGVEDPTVWYSTWAKASQTAEIVCDLLVVERTRRVPEYSFLDARGLGLFEGLPMDIADPFLNRLDSQGISPPSTDDATPNESLQDVKARVQQILSIVETFNVGTDIVIVSPDSEVLSVWQAVVAGAPIQGHRAFSMEPGELRECLYPMPSVRTVGGRASSPPTAAAGEPATNDSPESKGGIDTPSTPATIYAPPAPDAQAEAYANLQERIASAEAIASEGSRELQRLGPKGREGEFKKLAEELEAAKEKEERRVEDERQREMQELNKAATQRRAAAAPAGPPAGTAESPGTVTSPSGRETRSTGVRREERVRSSSSSSSSSSGSSSSSRGIGTGGTSDSSGVSDMADSGLGSMFGENLPLGPLPAVAVSALLLFEARNLASNSEADVVITDAVSVNDTATTVTGASAHAGSGPERSSDAVAAEGGVKPASESTPASATPGLNSSPASTPTYASSLDAAQSIVAQASRTAPASNAAEAMPLISASPAPPAVAAEASAFPEVPALQPVQSAVKKFEDSFEVPYLGYLDDEEEEAEGSLDLGITDSGISDPTDARVEAALDFLNNPYYDEDEDDE